MLNRLRSMLNRRARTGERREAAPRAAGPSAAYRPASVRLFIKPYCPWCRQAMEWLDHHSIPYATLDVIRDRAAYDEMHRLSGQTLAPVIEVDGRVLADFGARELAEFWRKLPPAPSKPAP